MVKKITKKAKFLSIGLAMAAIVIGTTAKGLAFADSDLQLFIAAWRTPSTTYDLTGPAGRPDGVVDYWDLNQLVSSLNKASAPQPVGISGNWNLKFSDEFNSSSLDTAKWQPNWLGGSNTQITKPVGPEEVACYDPAQVSVSGGTLRLSAIQKACRASDGSNYSYASGIVESYNSYHYTYGVAEARMYLPARPQTPSIPANWPAFWSDGENWPMDGEIDTMEVLGTDTCWHYHYGTVNTQVGSCPWIKGKPGWHTFANKWSPAGIDFYYDGQYVGHVNQSITVGTSHYLILNHAISSGSITVPATVEVDYVRVWQ